MPTRQLYHVSSLEFRICFRFSPDSSGFVFRIYALCPIIRNKPNSQPPTIHHSPLTIHYFTKQTQFTVPPPSRWLHRVQKMRNEPNLSPPTPPIYNLQSTIYNPLAQSPHTKSPAPQQLCETNPISTRQKCETNPIYRTAGVSPAFPAPIMQNEPNLPPRPPHLCETNPIYPTHNRPPIQICETNPIFAYPSLSHGPNMRNEPNYSSGRKSPVRARHAVPLKCKTNPI